MKILLFSILIACSVSAQEYYRGGEKVRLTPLEPSSNITASTTSPSDSIVWYRTEQGKTVGVYQEIIVTWQADAHREKVLQGYPIISQKRLSKTITLIKLSATADVFLIAQELYLHEDVKSAHPNMKRERERR